jgi:threonine/homoserine/homoserine lactone efflux protein
MRADLAAFLGVAILVIVTPGPDTALTIRNALLGGRRSGVFTAGGVCTGQAVWALAAAAGVAALLRASEPAFVALKLMGAAYLVFLGARALVHAYRAAEISGAVRRRPARSGASAALAYRQGMLSNLGNPKMAVFFTSLLPQFAGKGGSGSFFAFLLLGLVFCLLTLGWLSAYAVVVAKAGDFLRRRSIRRFLDAITGVVLVGLGLRVATEER